MAVTRLGRGNSTDSTKTDWYKVADAGIKLNGYFLIDGSKPGSTIDLVTYTSSTDRTTAQLDAIVAQGLHQNGTAADNSSYYRLTVGGTFEGGVNSDVTVGRPHASNNNTAYIRFASSVAAVDHSGSATDLTQITS